MGAVAVRHLILLGAATVLAACKSTSPEQTGIRLGLTKQEVTAKFGDPAEVRDPVMNGRGQMEEVWLYYLTPDVETGRDVAAGVLTSGVGFFDDPTEGHRYLFVFIENRLDRWGPDGRAPRRIP